MSHHLQPAAELLWEGIAQQVPMLAAMRVSVSAWDGQRLVLRAPIECNQNDKGTGFAGSIATLCTISGWAVLTLWSQTRGQPMWVAIANSDMRYSKPAYGDLLAEVDIPDAQALSDLDAFIAKKGRGRVTVSVRVFSVHDTETVLVAEMSGQYALWPQKAA